MLIQNDRFDSICNLHGNTFSSYCINCKSNLCVYCINKHIQHKIINLSNIIPSEVEKKELFVKLNELKNLIDKIEEVKNNIIKELDKLKENNSIEIKFILELFSLLILIFLSSLSSLLLSMFLIKLHSFSE